MELAGAQCASSMCWSKRNHEGIAEKARKCAKTSKQQIYPTVVLDDVQRKVLEDLVTCVDAKASIVVTNPLAEGVSCPVRLNRARTQRPCKLRTPSEAHPG